MRYATAIVVLWAVLCTGTVFAQETTGAIIGAVTSQDGAPLPGVTLHLVDPEKGFDRTATSAADGRYKLVALQPARYELTAALSGFQSVKRPVRVELGRTVTNDIQMSLGAVTETIEVTSEAPQVDVTSNVTGMTVNTDLLTAQLPLSRDVTQITMLAPATMPADQGFDNGARIGSAMTQYFTPGQSLTSVGGSSVAENVYVVNGLNTTNFFQMMGSAYVPMEFVKEAQIKTGGYEAEFGRSTGGVINLVTKSGTNTFRGGLSAYLEPKSLQSQQPDSFEKDYDGHVSVREHNSDEERELAEINARIGGPIVRDRLFFFGFLRHSDTDQLEIFDTWAQRNVESTPYWGGKIDWSLTSKHRIEATYLSDASDVDVANYEFDPATRTVGQVWDFGVRFRGGDNAILRYTGVLAENILLSAQAGLNDASRYDRANSEEVCPYAWDERSGSLNYVGCWLFPFRGTLNDTRTAYRLDADLFFGNHSLRAGLDAEHNRSTSDDEYSGGVYYRYYTNGELFPEYPEEQELVREQHYDLGGTFDIYTNSAYVQDSWALTPALTINAGLRWESFENTNALGETYLDVSDQIAPRLGAVWDVSRNGRSKLFGSFGVYYLPVSSSTSVLQAGSANFTRDWYLFGGEILPDGSPSGTGDLIESTVIYDGVVPDVREAVDSSIDPMSQRELIVGYERLLGTSWSVGARFVYRGFDKVIEDINIAEPLWNVYGVPCMSPDALDAGEACVEELGWRLTNPGTDFSGYFDIDFDGVLDEIALTADEIGIPDAARNYRAVELTVHRRFSGRWMLQGSYTWSHLEGNYEGLVNSDLAQAMPNLNGNFDFAGMTEHSRGDLPNDRRHNLKLYGVYQFDFGLQTGVNFWYRSGRPLNGFGMHPTDPYSNAWGPYTFYNNGEACPRGCGGWTPDTWALDLMVRYDFDLIGADWFIRADVTNVSDNDEVTLLDEWAQHYNWLANQSYLMPYYFQPARTVRFGFGLSF